MNPFSSNRTRAGKPSPPGMIAGYSSVSGIPFPHVGRFCPEDLVGRVAVRSSRLLMRLECIEEDLEDGLESVFVEAADREAVVPLMAGEHDRADWQTSDLALFLELL